MKSVRIVALVVVFASLRYLTRNGEA
jgi:hypothetical protein